MNFEIHTGDNKDTLKSLKDNSIDAIVTDPPYGIDFLGKDWDANTGALETYQECLRVLKPGGYILAFSAARTYHHLAFTLERAGFEIRDQLMWIYSSGFPKAQDIGKAIQRRKGVEETEHNPNHRSSKSSNSLYESGHLKEEITGDVVCTDEQAQQWSGWKTALKPGHEPICMARKPFKGSTIDNVLTHGVGALNIDATRVDWEPGEQEKEQLWRERYMAKNVGGPTFQETNIKEQKRGGLEADAPQGRFPSNVIGEIPDYQKYFYCPKVSRRERHTGFEQESIPAPFGDVKGAYVNGERMAKVADDTGYASVGNNHPTVKPVALMRYLIQLVTPANSVVLDPFNGSGSTGMAAVELGHRYIGCELDPAYVDIATKRITAWNTESEPTNSFNQIFE